MTHALKPAMQIHSEAHDTQPRTTIQPFMRKGLRVVGLDADGWLLLEYRGAQIRSQGGLHILAFPDHPSHGAAAQDARHWMSIIDDWHERRAGTRTSSSETSF
jgi:hypothetical protein